MLASSIEAGQFPHDPNRTNWSSLKRKKFEHDQAQDEQFRKRAKSSIFSEGDDKLCEWLHKTGALDAARQTLVQIHTTEALNAATTEEKEAHELVSNQMMLSVGMTNNYVARVAAAVLLKLKEMNLIESDHIPMWKNENQLSSSKAASKPKEKKEKASK